MLLVSLLSSVFAVTAPQVQRADYSPFILRIDGPPAFDAISFKNVTQDRRASQADFELMAESLALALKKSHPDVLVEVVHAQEFLDPKNHLFCAERHLYVDFWGLEKTNWGYSLWAGCGLNDRFEWRQLRLDAPGIAQQLEQVTADVSQRLKRADQRACYQRTC